ncbi:hypothetical protein ES319_A06G107000v1 [Gossypium barbadense]|uniref:SNRNP25 ubiquitin-like domain-containing protein n=2 Tax=Gossypium TaxID=3633 RepID=A0A5J5VCM3_GOSBA|nr:hypothetical protein ES319_A06G107000v1 [Gossypium barbadense]TYH13123.1 hypothetical protein ES288_A06G119500v1 [Gossypium darwinii]
MEVEDFVTPTAAFENPRRSTSLTSLRIANGGSLRNSFLYAKLREEPIKLSVRKLDGSFFDVEILKMATIADLKLAVEHVFSQMPDQGLGEISWPHVWGHFCLCYDAQKLVSDTDQVVKYGIRDGHQLHFVRHVSSVYNLTKTRSKRSVARKRPYLIKSTSILKSTLKSKENDEEVYALDNDIANQRCHSLKKNHSFNDNKYQSPIIPKECQFRHSWRGFYSYSRMPSIKNRATSSKEDEIPPLLAKEQLKSKWDDEDIDDSDIKKSWEDEDELASPPV